MNRESLNSWLFLFLAALLYTEAILNFTAISSYLKIPILGTSIAIGLLAVVNALNKNK